MAEILGNRMTEIVGLNYSLRDGSLFNRYVNRRSLSADV